MLRPLSFSAQRQLCRVDTGAMHEPTALEVFKFLVAVCCALASFVEAISKKRSSILWGVLGFLYPLISVAVIYALPVAQPKAKTAAEPRGPSVLEETSAIMVQAHARLGRTY